MPPSACRARILATLVLSAAMLWMSPGVRADPAAEKDTGFELVTLPPLTGFDGQAHGLKNCRNAVKYSPDTALALCEAPRLDTRRNFGLRLFLVRSTQGRSSISFAAPEGGGDAYSARVTLFRSTTPPALSVVFVDYAAEFQYGTMVFVAASDGSLKRAGLIDQVAADEEDGQPVSPTPFAVLSRTPKGFSIGFDRPLHRTKRDGSLGPGQSVRFTYDARTGRLTRAP